MRHRHLFSRLISFILLLPMPSLACAQDPDAKQQAKRQVEQRVNRLVGHLAKEWHYPNTSADMGGGTYCMRTSIQRCLDDYAAVRQHYYEKLGFDEYEPLDKKMYRKMREDEQGVYLWDDRVRGLEGRLEHVRTFFVITTPDYSITGIMDPAEDGDPPVIQMTITVDPTTEIEIPPDEDEGAAESGE